MSRRLGAVIFCALFVLVAFIIYGIFARQTSAAALGKRAGAMDGRVTGAKEAGKAFSNPSGTVADLTVPDALEPPPLSFIPKRDVKGKSQVPGEQGKGQGPVTIARSGTAGPQNGAGSNTVPAALRTVKTPCSTAMAPRSISNRIDWPFTACARKGTSEGAAVAWAEPPMAAAAAVATAMVIADRRRQAEEEVNEAMRCGFLT